MAIGKNKVIAFLCLAVIALCTKSISDSYELNLCRNEAGFKEKSIFWKFWGSGLRLDSGAGVHFRNTFIP